MVLTHDGISAICVAILPIVIDFSCGRQLSLSLGTRSSIFLVDADSDCISLINALLNDIGLMCL
jgi:hypothetical protein